MTRQGAARAYARAREGRPRYVADIYAMGKVFELKTQFALATSLTVPHGPFARPFSVHTSRDRPSVVEQRAQRAVRDVWGKVDEADRLLV